MNEQRCNNYSRIAEAIETLQQNARERPTLEEIAKRVNLSASDFQELFTDWAGVSAENFLEYISVYQSKQILNTAHPTLFDAPRTTGYSPTALSHNSYVEIERMAFGEYEEKRKYLFINYSFTETLFGRILVASTHKGICFLAFSNDDQINLSVLENRFPKATFIEQTDDIQQNALRFFTKDWSRIKKIKLHLKGTEFQIKVWEALLKIPIGSLTTYGNIAETIRKPKAARAVGTAIGANPVAFLIPCHRVIQSSGALGGYMWGATRKAAMIGWEAAMEHSSSGS
jgi:AraC family transcriptional regulator of adaptative response/methylated-DNA-[protein]-cysteine methyltransferase